MLVVCNGMIRAGSTLQYNLLRGIVEVSGTGAGCGSFEHTESANTDLADSLNPGVIAVAKTHGIPPSMPGHLRSRLEGFRACYTYRDLRDVAVSARGKFGWDNERLVYQLDLAVRTYAAMREFRDQSNVLWQRYEDTVGDLVAAVRQAAEFLEVDIDDGAVAQIAEDASVTKAKAVMKTVRDHIEVELLSALPEDVRRTRRKMRSRAFLAFDNTTQLHWNHISPNEGKSGTWREHLSQEDVTLIETRYEEWFDDTKYPVG